MNKSSLAQLRDQNTNFRYFKETVISSDPVLLPKKAPNLNAKSFSKNTLIKKNKKKPSLHSATSKRRHLFSH